ncbi:hypothetical protein MKX01_014220 [Papaver californicum]|nr:hypothetical protein MKX01_014220 [Papaver californicum]
MPKRHIVYIIIYSLSTQLFNLPTDSKLKLGPSTSVETYTPHFIASPFFESFHVSGPDFFASAKSSTDNLFNPPSSEFSNRHGYLRIINYTQPEVVKEKEEVEGLGMHTDMSCVTIVYQDQVGGLQVRSKQGKWMDIKCLGVL